MTGISCIMAGSSSNGLTATMTVGSGAYTVAKVTYYVDGYIGAGSEADVLAPAIGSMTSYAFKGSTVRALYWTSASGHAATNGTVFIEASGNQSAGFITDVKIDGVSQGTLSAPTYYSGTNNTRFTVGTASSKTNPFGTSGTKTIVIS